MKRNMIEDLKIWGETAENPFFLYGLHGVGKTYLVNSYVNNFSTSFIYFKTEESDYYKAFIEGDAPLDFVAEHFGLNNDSLKNEIVIFDDTENYVKTASKLIRFAIINKCKWIFISDYDYLRNTTSGLTKKQLFPVQFDEFLVAVGSEWYVEAIKGHFESRKKLPDIVHNELLSDFEEYIWVGGMPEVLSNYVETRSSINVTGLQKRNKKLSLSLDFAEDNRKVKCDQVLSCLGEQLYKDNQKFMFNVIRNGVTYNMYADTLDYLEGRGLIIRQNEYSSKKKFKLFYPEFSFISSSRHDEITDVEYNLRIQNYVLQTLKQKGIECCFWESGNRADLDFVIRTIDTQFPVDFGFSSKNNSKSVSSFTKKTGAEFSLVISDSNYFTEVGRYSVPVYSLFCFDVEDATKKI